ncbi:MAG: M42 family metallopeptidase [Deinococcus sp.]|nr:M42 family metallopeptidase [Deinococcus sp.]
MNQDFLKELLLATGPAGFEAEAVRVWANQARTFAQVQTDKNGNAYATINRGGSPRIMLAGHADEIGIIVSYLDENGFVYFKPLGGWDPQVLVGQRISFVGPKGKITGVVGRKATHLLTEEDKRRAVTVDELWVDIGAKDGKEARDYLEVGSVGVIDQPPVQLLGRRWVSKAIDNRIGAFVVLEALRLAKESGVRAEVTAVATVQEEIGHHGARTSSFKLKPDTALVVDVHHCSRVPGTEKKRVGEGELGKGPVLDVGPYIHPKVLGRLRELAAKAQISYALNAHTAKSSTDTDDIAFEREGVPAALVSVPNRYMHSPSEMIDLDDVEACIKLLALYAENPVEEFSR